MGYYVSMSMDNVKFPVSKEPQFWKLVVKFYRKQKFTSPKQTVCDEFMEWGFVCEKEGGYYVVKNFVGEKLHSHHENLWKTLAPIMDTGAIWCDGESSDDRWKWVFQGGKFMVENGRWIWNDEGVFRMRGVKK